MLLSAQDSIPIGTRTFAAALAKDVAFALATPLLDTKVGVCHAFLEVDRIYPRLGRRMPMP